jgi:hypothetical protein
MASRFLFLTGEPSTTLPLLKTRPDWAPVLSAITFDATGKSLRRSRSNTDDFRGCVYFADVRDKDIERHNLSVLAAAEIPCWPSPTALLALSSRREMLAQAAAAGLLNHLVAEVKSGEPLLPFPCVLKVGDEHRGEGKYLLRSAADVVRWEGIATVEPYFEGESARVLCIGERAFGVRIRNDGDWIKNSPGAVVEAWTPDPALVAHALRAAGVFGLEVAGVDYVIDADGPHFLEINPFPRVGVTSESAAVARGLFAARMDGIEAAVGR